MTINYTQKIRKTMPLTHIFVSLTELHSCFGEFMFSGAQVRNKKKTRRIRRQNHRRLYPCVRQAKEAHQTDQADQPSLGSDYLTRGPTDQSPRRTGGERRHRGVGRIPGSAEPTLKPVQVHFGGKAVLILLMAV